jgi:hypothetical protein
MKVRCLPLAVALACAMLPMGVMAQASPTAPSSAASAPPAATLGPKQLTLQQSRDSATTPGNLRPEHATVPQINMPFGKTPAAAPKTQSNPPRGANAASGVGIDDAVARCEAEPDRSVREVCRAQLARQGGNR